MAGSGKGVFHNASVWTRREVNQEPVSRYYRTGMESREQLHNSKIKKEPKKRLGSLF